MLRPRNKYDREWNRSQEEREKVKIQCKHCGRKAIIPVWVDKQLCTWCGHYIYRNKKLEFLETMKKKGIVKNVRKWWRL